jgi:hypothetical protein
MSEIRSDAGGTLGPVNSFYGNFIVPQKDLTITKLGSYGSTTREVRLYSGKGTGLLASVSISGSGFVFGTLSTPYKVTANTKYWVATTTDAHYGTTYGGYGLDGDISWQMDEGNDPWALGVFYTNKTKIGTIKTVTGAGNVITLPVYDPAAGGLSSQALRTQLAGGKLGCIDLVPTTDATASPMRIYQGGAIKSLQKL